MEYVMLPDGTREMIPPDVVTQGRDAVGAWVDARLKAPNGTAATAAPAPSHDEET